MARPAKGSLLIRKLTDGTLTFRLRFSAHGRRQDVYLHERRDCACGCGGGWNERTARVELENLVARARAGVWEPAKPTGHDGATEDAAAMPTFEAYAREWFEAKRDGVLGDKPLSESTCKDYSWRLRLYLLPFFGRYRLDQIDRRLCLAFKAKLLRDAKELREVIASGAVLRDRQGRPRRPLGPPSMKKVLTALATILDEAMEDGHIDHNPARGRRMRVRVPKPKRTFLEIDELACVEDAAGAQEAPLLRSLDPGADRKPDSTRAKVAERLAAGTPPSRIAAQLGIAKSTVSHHLERLGARPSPYIGRRAILTTLGRSGVRIGELCDIRIGHLRLHDPGGARLQIPDAKTEAGVREVQISPDLVEQLVMHLDRLRRAGRPTGPEAWGFPNSRGGQLSRQRAAKIVGEAAALASERMAARGLPPLPHVTPHTLRRTYISIALLANNFDVLWVMSQVGHADSKMTLDVYAQLQQRVKRSHGTAFDRLVRQAREELRGNSQPTADSTLA
jgi:integrase